MAYKQPIYRGELDFQELKTQFPMGNVFTNKIKQPSPPLY